MQPTPNRTTAARGWRHALSLLLALALVPALGLWVHLTVGFGALLAPWQRLGALDLAVLLVGVTVTYAARALRVYDYFHDLTRGYPLVTLRLSLLHNLWNNLLPLRSGEAAFPVLMKRYFGERMSRTTASLLWLRLLDLGALILGAATVIAIAPGTFPPPTRHLALVGALVSAGALVTIVWLAGQPAASATQGSLRSRVTRVLMGSLPPTRAQALRILTWTLLSWAGKGLAFVWLVVTFSGLSAARAAIGVAAGELSSVLPIHGIAGSGTYEAATVGALMAVGVTHDTALLAAVNVHLFLLGVSLMTGIGALTLPLRDSAATARTIG